MFDMNVNVRVRLSLNFLKSQIHDSLAGLGMRDQSFFDAALKEPCIDPAVGTYVEMFGIDRLCDWHGLTEKEFERRCHGMLPNADLEIINTKVADHLVACARCLADSLEYALYIEDRMPAVLDMSTECLAEVTSVQSLPADQALDIQERMILSAYGNLVSVERMRARDAFWAEIKEVPCENPKLWKRIEKEGILKLAEMLPKSDTELRQERWRTKLTYRKRMELLHELSDHVETCLRCSVLRDDEVKDEYYLDALRETLRVRRTRQPGTPPPVFPFHSLAFLN